MSSPCRSVDLAVHTSAPLSGCLISEVGAVIGAHIGPGMLGVAVLPDGLAPPA